MLECRTLFQPCGIKTCIWKSEINPAQGDTPDDFANTALAFAGAAIPIADAWPSLVGC